MTSADGDRMRGWQASDRPDYEVLQFRETAPGGGTPRKQIAILRSAEGFLPVICAAAGTRRSKGEPTRGAQAAHLSDAVAEAERWLGLEQLDLAGYSDDISRLLGLQPPAVPCGWQARFEQRCWWDGDRGGGTFLACYDIAEPHDSGTPLGRALARVWYNGEYFYAKYYGRSADTPVWHNVGGGPPRHCLSAAIAEVEEGRALAGLISRQER